MIIITMKDLNKLGDMVIDDSKRKKKLFFLYFLFQKIIFLFLIEIFTQKYKYESVHTKKNCPLFKKKKK
jgi:hypothetical protein